MSASDDPYEVSGIPRDRWGRPLVVPPNGGKPTAYTRCTTYAGSVEDTYKLGQWLQRMVALGLAHRPDLMVSVAAFHDDRDELNKICDTAIEAAKGRAAAGVGTALHALADRLDRGEALGPVPPEYDADLAAFAQATKPLKVLGMEQFVVYDELKIGGTFDRLYEYGGQRFIGDTKSGSIEWGAGKIAMQLAIYSRSVSYDHKTKTRTPLGDVNQDLGIVVHMPAGQGTCRLKWVDIAAGWQAVQLATEVRAWRSRKKLIYPFDPVVEAVREVFPETEDITLLEQIGAATSRADLEALYRNRGRDWTEEELRTAKQRTTQIHGRVLKNAAVKAADQKRGSEGESDW